MPVLQRNLRLSDRQRLCLQNLAEQRRESGSELGDEVRTQNDVLSVRAQAILMMDEGYDHREICRQLTLGHSELARVRRRFMILGLSGLHDVTALAPRRSTGHPMADLPSRGKDAKAPAPARVSETRRPTATLPMPHTRTDSKSAASAADRFRALREKLRLSRPQLAQRLGVTRQYITKIEGGMPPSKPVMLLVERMEQEARIPSQDPVSSTSRPQDLEPVSRDFAMAGNSWDTHAQGSSSDATLPETPPSMPVSKRGGSTGVPRLVPAVRSLPVLAMHEAASLADPHTAASPSQQQLSFVVEDEHAFAVRITGESMNPHYPEGSIAIVCPSLPPRNGDLLLVRLKDERGGGALLRIVHFSTPDTAEGLVLTSTHPAYPPLTVRPEDLLWQAPVAVSLRHLR